ACHTNKKRLERDAGTSNSSLSLILNQVGVVILLLLTSLEDQVNSDSLVATVIEMKFNTDGLCQGKNFMQPSFQVNVYPVCPTCIEYIKSTEDAQEKEGRGFLLNLTTSLQTYQWSENQ